MPLPVKGNITFIDPIDQHIEGRMPEISRLNCNLILLKAGGTTARKPVFVLKVCNQYLFVVDEVEAAVTGG